MKKTAFLIIILAFSFSSYAQTEKIAQRSHSGSDKTFKVTGYNNWGDTPAMRAEREKRDAEMKAKADSIARKKQADSLAKQKPQKPKRPKNAKSKKIKNQKNQKTRFAKYSAKNCQFFALSTKTLPIP